MSMKVIVVPLEEKCHVETLGERDLDRLIDKHLFGYQPYCTGPAEYRYHTEQVAVYRCLTCGVTEERLLAGPSLDRCVHERCIPRYGLEEILVGMRAQDRKTQMRFTLALRIAVDGALLPRSPGMAVQHVLLAMTPRLVAIAALNALDIIDARGFLVERSNA